MEMASQKGEHDEQQMEIDDQLRELEPFETEEKSCLQLYPIEEQKSISENNDIFQRSKESFHNRNASKESIHQRNESISVRNISKESLYINLS